MLCEGCGVEKPVGCGIGYCRQCRDKHNTAKRCDECGEDLWSQMRWFHNTEDGLQIICMTCGIKYGLHGMPADF